ncbi:MAG: hypothetical protein K8S97_16220 [Anaerolineae bacterium]|nr:hypothetical protein [Anaerolineae bacterium]
MSRQDYTFPTWMAYLLLWPHAVHGTVRRVCWRSVALLGVAWVSAQIVSPALLLEPSGGVLTVQTDLAYTLLQWHDTLRRIALPLIPPLVATLAGSLVFMQFARAPVIVQLFAGIVARVAYVPVLIGALLLVFDLAIWCAERPLEGAIMTTVVLVLLGVVTEALLMFGGGDDDVADDLVAGAAPRAATWIETVLAGMLAMGVVLLVVG